MSLPTTTCKQVIRAASLEHLPGRIDLGIDTRWRMPFQRMRRSLRDRRLPVLLRHQYVDSRGHVEIAASGTVLVNGALRGLFFAFLVEGAAAIVIVVVLVARRGH